MDFMLTCRRCEHWEPIASYHDLRYHLRVVHNLRQLANSDLCLYATHPHADIDVLRYGPIESRPSTFMDARHSISVNRPNPISYGDLSDVDSGIVNERISEMVAQGIERGIASVMASKRSDSDREKKRPIQPPSDNQKLIPTRIIYNEGSIKRKAVDTESESVTNAVKKMRKTVSETGEKTHQTTPDEEVKDAILNTAQSDAQPILPGDIDEELYKLEERARALKNLDLPAVLDSPAALEKQTDSIVEKLTDKSKTSAESSSKQIAQGGAPILEEKLVNREAIDDASKQSINVDEPVLEQIMVLGEGVDKTIAQPTFVPENPNASVDSEKMEEVSEVSDGGVQLAGSTSGSAKKRKQKNLKEQNVADSNETDSVSTPKTRSEHRRARK